MKITSIESVTYRVMSFIDGILEKLDIRDLVRTSILSTKWRYLWTSVPRLRFPISFFERYEHLDDPGPIVSKIITDILMLHNGPIYKFFLYMPLNFNFKITVEHLDSWFPILSRWGIKHLKLFDFETALSHLPYIVFSCTELTKFSLGGCGSNLSIPPNFSGFKRLLKLNLYYVTFESSALESLISGCPLLERLSVQDCDGFEYFHISAPTLKVLFLQYEHDVKSICLKKAKNLIDFTLIAGEGRVSGFIKSLPKNMQRFSINGSNYDGKIPYAEIIPPTLVESSFNSIKYLKLGDVHLNERRELLYIVNVLKSAPCLVELGVEGPNFVCFTQVPDRSEELECSSRFWLHRLQTVNIHITYGTQHAMSLIRFILANSTSLETLNFTVSFGLGKLDAALLATQDLLWMERASPRARVRFRPLYAEINPEKARDEFPDAAKTNGGRSRVKDFMDGMGLGMIVDQLRQKIASATSAFKSVFGQEGTRQDADDKLEKLEERMIKVPELFVTLIQQNLSLSQSPLSQ